MDNFGVKFLGKKHVQHPIDTLKNYYEISFEYTGGLYYGIKMNWDYANETIVLTIPDYNSKSTKVIQLSHTKTLNSQPIAMEDTKIWTENIMHQH